MSRNVLVALTLLGAVGAWQHFSGKPQPAPHRPEQKLVVPTGDTVVVYGRDNCGYTRQTLASLRADGIPVTYVDIDYADGSRAFHERFDGTGLAGERGYALPMVDVAGHASTRPDPAAVARTFRSTR